MRLKTFHADNLSAALALVRDTLGDNAIIVATQEDDEGEGGARVTAAVEEADGAGWTASPEVGDALERITDALERHGTPRALTDRLVEVAGDAEESEAEMALAAALDRLFAFRPLPEGPGGAAIMLVGPPGVGKTVSCAKIAARVALSHDSQADTPPIILIAADCVRIGAVDQLRAYAERLNAPIREAADAAGLRAALRDCPPGRLIIIDTHGVNPYDMEDLAHLAELRSSAAIEPVLLLSAGRDAEEAGDLAKAFRPVEPTRLLTTGADLARRLGAMLAAADAGRLAFSNISFSPRIGDGLKPLNPLSLARLLLRDTVDSEALELDPTIDREAAGHEGDERGADANADSDGGSRPTFGQNRG